MNISLARFYKNSNGWDLATLSDKEMDQVHKAVSMRNNQIFKECMEDAIDIINGHQLTYGYALDVVSRIALQLFESYSKIVKNLLSVMGILSCHLSIREPLNNEGRNKYNLSIQSVRVVCTHHYCRPFLTSFHNMDTLRQCLLYIEINVTSNHSVFPG